MTRHVASEPAEAAQPAHLPVIPPLTRQTLQMRVVQRAAAELKRGLPVLIEGRAPLVVLAAETASVAGLADLAALSELPGCLLLAPVRAAAALHRPVEQTEPAVALRLRADMLMPDVLRAYADPTLDQVLPPVPDLMAPPLLADAALALAKLARLLPALVVAPAVPYAVAHAESRGLLTVGAEVVLAYPSAAATGLRRVAETPIPLEDAPDARIVAFRAPDSGVEHLAIVIGTPDPAHPTLARVHSECFTGDLLGSLRCDCGAQLRGAIRRMAQEGSGVLLYLAQEGRGIGLVNKLRAYALQDRGLDTLDANCALGWGADERNFVIAAVMLRELGVGAVRLLTNNPDKVSALAACGVEVAERVGHSFRPNGVNDAYLATKARRFGHMLD